MILEHIISFNICIHLKLMFFIGLSKSLQFFCFMVLLFILGIFFRYFFYVFFMRLLLLAVFLYWIIWITFKLLEVFVGFFFVFFWRDVFVFIWALRLCILPWNTMNTILINVVGERFLEIVKNYLNTGVLGDLFFYLFVKDSV